MRTRSHWLLKLIVIFVCCATGYVLWLDYLIQSRFEGKRWALPARVYARPTEIYPGLEMPADELETELREAGYRKVTTPMGAGQYARKISAIEFTKRVFQYWDGEDPQQHLEIKFTDNKVQRIEDLSTRQTISLARLEPPLIGKITPSHHEDRVLVPYRDVPPFLVEALVASEDRHFYRHKGLDFSGIGRALFANIRRGGIVQGGSTLTQQLVKNFFLSQERTYRRKFNEMIMALLLERRYSKAEILSAYINEIYLGQHGSRSIHGFGTAAEYYFSKPLQELRPDQLALLVGMVRGASYYNPHRHPERAKQRRDLVLTLMQQQGYIEERFAKNAQARSLDIAPRPGWSFARYPAFMDLVRRQLLQDYKMEDLQSEGLRIFTTLDPQIQDRLERVAPAKLAALEQQKSLAPGSLQTAIVMINIGTGEVIALAGGRDKDSVGFNRVLDAKRPIGSLIKPAIYLTALSNPQKYNLLTLIDDKPVTLQENDGRVWQPANYDRVSHGHVTLLEALANSYNLATVNLGMDVGLDKVIATLKALGIDITIKPYPSLLLGSVELTPVEVTQMYQTLANGGFKTPLNSIREVLDSHGKALQHYGLQVEQTLPAESVLLTNFILAQVVERGTARSIRNKLQDKLPIAGKTGTTNELRDSWFAGFGDDLLGVVWLGRDDNKPAKFTGASGAMQIWAEIMQSINLRPLTLIAPTDIAWSERVHIPFAEDCIDIRSVPYRKDYRLDTADRCRNKAGVGYNPLFQDRPYH